MIPVAKARKPKTFDEKVYQPGLRAISEMVGKPPRHPRQGGKPFKKIANRERDIPAEKFPTYWTEALNEMMHAYRQLCAYSCFRIHPVTGARSADHFAPKSKSWREVYKWSNYRLCCSRMNARKKDWVGIIDPFKIQPDWFQLELVGFQVIPDRNLPLNIQNDIQNTITALGLDDFRSEREQDAERYWQNDYSLKILKMESPFVAYELYRQGRLNPMDTW
ncbi:MULTISPECIES: hypothetical protein [Pseudomonas]|nr:MULTISPECIES: hypothetical protein [Pseudomonas]SDY00909.1 hypothetical protein SAMN03159474_04433 [Pseudomonas sp. NFACC08-1]